jgi:arylsulfatase A-like enzyme
VTRAGEHEDALINGVDVPATIAHLAGSTSTTFGDGQSFRDALSNASFEGREYIYTDGIRDIGTTGAMPGWTVREGQYKLIHRDDTGDEELYDLSVDPWEETNLIDSTDVPASVVESLHAIHDDLVGSGS